MFDVSFWRGMVGRLVVVGESDQWRLWWWLEIVSVAVAGSRGVASKMVVEGSNKWFWSGTGVMY